MYLLLQFSLLFIHELVCTSEKALHTVINGSSNFGSLPFLPCPYADNQFFLADLRSILDEIVCVQIEHINVNVFISIIIIAVDPIVLNEAVH